jgi:hypothetical protein
MAASVKVAAFWDMAPCSLVEEDGRFRGTASIIKTLMMEGVSSSETSFGVYHTTRHNVPEGCHLHPAIR